MRTLCWISQGAASVIAAKIMLNAEAGVLLLRCETNNEDEDNARFEADALAWLGASVTILKSDAYDSVVDVWDRRKYMSGVDGAPCTVEMKIAPRLSFQRPTDVHVFGYTADRADVERFERLRTTYPELRVRAPLIEAGITKAGTIAMLMNAGISPPRTYAMGFPNANCLKSGCSKATSPDYWSLYRFHFPDRFEVTAARARRLGVRLTRIKDERCFIDEIPANWPMTRPIAPACDFLCVLAEQDLAGAV